MNVLILVTQHSISICMSPSGVFELLLAEHVVTLHPMFPFGSHVRSLAPYSAYLAFGNWPRFLCWYRKFRSGIHLSLITPSQFNIHWKKHGSIKACLALTGMFPVLMSAPCGHDSADIYLQKHQHTGLVLFRQLSMSQNEYIYSHLSCHVFSWLWRRQRKCAINFRISQNVSIWKK